METAVKKVRIKTWFLLKNNMYDSNGMFGKNGRYNECSWLSITRETEKAVHLDEMQYNIPKGGWVPKSALLEIK